MLGKFIMSPNILLSAVCLTNSDKRNLSMAFPVWDLTVFILQGEIQKEFSSSEVPTLLKFW